MAKNEEWQFQLKREKEKIRNEILFGCREANDSLQDINNIKTNNADDVVTGTKKIYIYSTQEDVISKFTLDDAALSFSLSSASSYLPEKIS